MDCAQGQVVGIQGDMALVATRRAALCAGCPHEEGCDALGLHSSNEQTVEAFNTAQASVGDTVAVDIEPRGLLTISFLLYMFPVIAALTGAAIGSTWGESLLGWNSDTAAILFFAVGLVAAMTVLKLLHPRLSRRKELRLNITEILPRTGEPDPGTVEG